VVPVALADRIVRDTDEDTVEDSCLVLVTEGVPVAFADRIVGETVTDLDP
jgi:hypothetical protein